MARPAVAQDIIQVLITRCGLDKVLVVKCRDIMLAALFSR